MCTTATSLSAWLLYKMWLLLETLTRHLFLKSSYWIDDRVIVVILCMRLFRHGHNFDTAMFLQVRSRALVQYTTPFTSVSLQKMAAAFSTDQRYLVLVLIQAWHIPYVFGSMLYISAPHYQYNVTAVRYKILLARLVGLKQFTQSIYSATCNLISQGT